MFLQGETPLNISVQHLLHRWGEGAAMCALQFVSSWYNWELCQLHVQFSQSCSPSEPFQCLVRALDTDLGDLESEGL